MALHVYESHMGGYFTTEEELTTEQEYCDQCGDNDWYLGAVDTQEEAAQLYEKHIDYY